MWIVNVDNDGLVVSCSIFENSIRSGAITRSVQLPHIPVTAFSQTDLFLA